MSGAPARVRWVLRQVVRAPLRSVLTAAAALAFALALLWLRATIVRSEAEVAEMYRSLQVNITIEQSINGATRSRDAFSGNIDLRKIDDLKAEGLLQSAFFQTSLHFDTMFPVAGPEDGSPVFYDTARFSMLTNQLHGLYFEPGEGSGRLPEITYAPGHDERLFSRPWTQDDLLREYPAPVVAPALFEQSAELLAQRQVELQKLPGFSLPVVLPTGMMEQLEISLGDPFYLFYVQTQLRGSSMTAVPCVAAGVSAAGQEGSVYPLAPQYALEVFASHIDRQMLTYDEVRLTVAPDKNQQLAEVCRRLDALLKDRQSGPGVWLEMAVWDEELRLVVEPMEKSFCLLRTLYPIAVGVSALISTGLALLLTMQRAKDAAVMRVLGASKAQIWRTLCAEQLCLCSAGLAAGFLLSPVVARGMAGQLLPQLLVCAALYAIGALAGVSAAALFMLRHRPLVLLQVRE